MKERSQRRRVSVVSFVIALRCVLAEDIDVVQYVGKKDGKEKKPKIKKEKKKKEKKNKDPTSDRSIESLYGELVSKNVIRKVCHYIM